MSQKENPPMMKRLIAMMECAVLAGMLVCVSPAPPPAEAQWQVPNYSMPVGRGAGTGFKSVGPCVGGFPVWSSGSSADPLCSNALAATGAPAIISDSNDSAISGLPTPNRIYVIDGSLAAPVTGANIPSMQISRHEAVVGVGGPQSSALYVASHGDNSAGNNGNIAVSVSATSLGGADTIGLHSVVSNAAASGTFRAAFAAFLDARCAGVDASCMAIETAVQNSTGRDLTYSSSAGPQVVFAGGDWVYDGVAGQLGSAYHIHRASNGTVQVGLGFWPGSLLSTDGGSVIRDDSESHTVFDINGTHTYVLDTVGATTTVAARFGSQQILQWRNAAGLADVQVLWLDASDNLRIGGTGFSGIIALQGDTVPLTDSAYDLGVTATRWRNGYIDTLTLTNPLAVASGGSNCAVASGTCLDNITGFSSTGILARTGSGTYAFRTLTGPAAGISVSNGDGVSGNPTLALANDLSALEGLSSTGFAARTTTDTWAQRTIAGTSNRIDVTNGDGVSGNPTLDISASYVGQSSITTLGTIGTGVWNAGSVTSTGLVQGTSMSVANNITAFGVGTPAFSITSSSGSELGINLTNNNTGGRNWGTFSTGGGSGLGQGNFVFYDNTTGGLSGARVTIFSSGAVSIGNLTDQGTAGSLDVTDFVRVGTKIRAAGTAPAVSSCGTTPAISGSDLAGMVTTGTGTPTSCTITFNAAYSAEPYCVVRGKVQAQVTDYTVSTTAIVVTTTATNNVAMIYHCYARAAGWLLKRDLDPAANDNTPAFMENAA